MQNSAANKIDTVESARTYRSPAYRRLHNGMEFCSVVWADRIVLLFSVRKVDDYANLDRFALYKLLLPVG